MNIEELKTKTEDELKKLLLELRKTQFNERFQKTQGTLENTAQIRKTRRSIARVKTLLNSKTEDSKPSAPKKAKKKAASKAA